MRRVDSDCGENAEKELKNRKKKERKSLIIQERFFQIISATLSPASFSTGGPKGVGGVSVTGERARDLSREFFSSQLRENLPCLRPSPLLTVLLAIFYLFT